MSEQLAADGPFVAYGEKVTSEPPVTLDVQLLGQFAVTRDGHRVELRSQPAQMLLAYLALHEGQSMPRDRIIGALWPDASTGAARKKLRQTLWRLRRVIGDEHLEVDPRSLRLISDRITSDVASLQRDDVPDDPEALASAVGSYRGELLPGHYGDWVQAASGPLRATFENRMSRLLGVLSERQRWDELRVWSERWIAQGSVPEPAYRALMRAHAGMGDLAGVANAYARCQAALLREIGVEPSAKTRSLYERLMTGHDTSRVAADGGAVGHGEAVLPLPSIRHAEAGFVIEQCVVIERPYHEIYTAAVNPDIALLCRANVVEYEVIRGEPGQKGTQVLAAKKLGRDVRQFVVEVLEADPGRWLKSRAVESPFGLQIETWLDDVTGATRMSQRRTLDVPKGLFGGLDDRVAARLYASDVRSDLGRLKDVLEIR